MPTKKLAITEAQIETLKNEAGQAGDFRQVGLCVLAAEGVIDFADSDWAVLSEDDCRWLRTHTQASALAACIEAVNDGS